MIIRISPITQEILDKVEVIVKDMLEERFAADGLVFDPIFVERKIDYYDDEYIDIRIVFDGKEKLLDVDWTISMARRIHEELEAEGIYLGNAIGKRFVKKSEWDYTQKHGWDYIEEHGWPPEDDDEL